MVKKLLLMSMLGLAACAASPVDATSVDEAASTVSDDGSRATEVGNPDVTIPAAVTCTSISRCRLCGNRRMTENLDILSCSDGTETIVHVGPCGESCL
jgi:hypothetical protein